MTPRFRDPERWSAVTETKAMHPGTVCTECGAPVDAKEIVPGSVLSSPDAPVRFYAADRLGRNLPCGHEALAVLGLP